MCLVTQFMSNSLWPHGLQPTRLLCPWGFSRQEYWSGLPCPPPGDRPIQGSNPGLPHCRRILYQLSHQGSPIEHNFYFILQFSSVQFSHSVMSDSLRPHELQHARPPCPSPTPGVFLIIIKILLIYKNFTKAYTLMQWKQYNNRVKKDEVITVEVI